MSGIEILVSDHHGIYVPQVFGTRVVCNPVGYPGERMNINTSLVLEI